MSEDKDITDVEFKEVGEQDKQDEMPQPRGVDPAKLSMAFVAVDELFTEKKVTRIEGYIVLAHLVCRTAIEFRRSKEDMLDVLGEVYNLMTSDGVDVDKIETPKF
jgi:hypothetical protein